MRENKYITYRDNLYKIVPGEPLSEDDFSGSTFTYNDPIDRIYKARWFHTKPTAEGAEEDYGIEAIYWELIPQGQFIDDTEDGVSFFL